MRRKKNNRRFLLVLLFFLFNTASGEQKLTLNEKFANVLLVVHYNHPYYNSIPFIEDLYSSIFPNIVFFGEAPHPKVNVIRTEKGYKFSKVVANVLDRFPGYVGYIFLQDDCFMNFWNYERLDTTKFWFMENDKAGFRRTDITNINISSLSWWFGHPTVGMKQYAAALKQIDPQELFLLEKNHGKNQCIGFGCDMFYIPQKFAKQALNLSLIFSNVFCELSIPTILSCIDELSNWEKLNALWFVGSSAKVLPAYSPEYDWVHPLKFSCIEDRDFAVKQIHLNFKE